MRVTIDLPERDPRYYGKGTTAELERYAYATTYTQQADGSYAQCTIHGPGTNDYWIVPNWGKLTICKTCLKHRKVPGCSGPCPHCAAGDLCKCPAEDEGDWWYEGGSCGAADDEPCRAVASGAFETVCAPCYSKGKHPTMDDLEN